jgi:hypothetical protein
MTTRFELTINPNYVKDWTVEDAIRELYQNAFDNEILNKNSKTEINYDNENKELSIISTNTILEKDTLLLGNTTKADNGDTVGCFGEGYKLAMLILARNGHSLEIKNEKACELWVPKIITSRRFNSKLLVVDVKKLHRKECVDGSLIFKIKNIGACTYLSTKDNILQTDDIEMLSTDFGDILLSKTEAGKIYTNKLFVSKEHGFKYGYNIKPEFIPVGRDRKHVDFYKLKDIILSMWKKIALQSEYNFDLFYEIVSIELTELSSLAMYSIPESLKLACFHNFKNKNLINAVPVYTESDREFIEKFHKDKKPVGVVYALSSIICGFYEDVFKSVSEDYIFEEESSPYKTLLKLKNSLFLSDKETAYFDAVLKQSKSWTSPNKSIEFTVIENNDYLKTGTE